MATLKRIFTESVLAQAALVASVVYPIAQLGFAMASPVAQ